MPSGAIIFRMFIFFIFLGILFTFSVWLVNRVFGTNINYWKKVSEWRARKKEEAYEKRFQQVTGGYYDGSKQKKK